MTQNQRIAAAYFSLIFTIRQASGLRVADLFAKKYLARNPAIHAAIRAVGK